MDWSFGDVFWSMMVFFFWVVYFWMFISIFADIFRREDLSGWAKAGWIFLIIILPFIGILLYVIIRPKMTAQDKRMLTEIDERQKRASGYSAADEIAKLSRLRDEGTITAEEFDSLKRRALA
ncbi:MAG: SHOCT domain-containing protein [Catenulispora sp.]|nr:SHOCT domain-containing protein [Catenulispora sp.]